MATDLNLHRKTAVHNSNTEEGRAREIEVHNRDRTWIVCFTLDRCISAQMGKPHTIKEEWVMSCLYLTLSDSLPLKLYCTQCEAVVPF
jgi:hypothetical protein